MAVGTQFKASAYYTEWFIGKQKRVQWAFYVPGSGSVAYEPWNLVQYDSVRLQIYDSDAAASLRHDFPLTVLTADADKIANSSGTLVSARARADVIVTGATGEIRCKVIGITGGVTRTLLDRPWKANVFLAGPDN